MTDTIILSGRSENESVLFYIALAPRDVHCVRCVTEFPPINTHILLNLIIADTLFVIRTACQQTDPAVGVSGSGHTGFDR